MGKQHIIYVMNKIPELLPRYCHSESTMRSIRMACAINRTSKDLYESTSKEDFWRDLALLIGKGFSKEVNSSYYEFIKHLKCWAQNSPQPSHEVIQAYATFNHPIIENSQLKIVSIGSKIHVDPLLRKRSNRRQPDVTPIFTTESKKIFTCVANSGEFLAVNRDDSTVRIYENHKPHFSYSFKGVIYQLEIQNDYLYVVGLIENVYSLNIVNLVKKTVKDVLIPQLPYVANNTWFSTSHLVISSTNGHTTTLLAASYEDLLNNSEDSFVMSSINGQVSLFANGEQFIALVFKTYHSFEVGELTCPKNYQVIDSKLTILQSPNGLYQAIRCIQRRIFITYNESAANWMCTYDLETKKMSHIKLTDGPSLIPFLPLPYFISTTLLKVYYLTYPYENNEYNFQKISIFELDYGSPKEIPNDQNDHNKPF